MGNSFNRSIPLIDEHVKSHCIVMYSTTVCSYCTKAKHLLNEMQMDYNVVELNLLSQTEGGRVVEELIHKTKITSVPQIFINGEFIGGYTEMLALKQTGSLFEKIRMCSKPCTRAG